MPIYEYQCDACGHVFENLQKISEAPPTKCPDCGADALKKLVSAPAFRLKGSGWYETDFKTGDKKNLDKSGKTGKPEKTTSKSTSDGKSSKASTKSGSTG